MQLPIINILTGTARCDLQYDYFEANRALRNALEKLSEVSPNGRDYQGGDINAAMREHGDRCNKIRQVLAEIETIAESLA